LLEGFLTPIFLIEFQNIGLRKPSNKRKSCNFFLTLHLWVSGEPHLQEELDSFSQKLYTPTKVQCKITLNIQLFLQTYCQYIGYLLFRTPQKPLITYKTCYNISMKRENRSPNTPKIESNSLNAKTTTQNLSKYLQQRKPVFLNAMKI